MRFIKNNIFTILCFGGVVWYLFDEFDTTKERVLFIATLIVFLFGMLFSTRIIRYIIADNLSLRETIIRMKPEIMMWTIAAGILLFFVGLRFTGILLLGVLLYAVLIAAFYWIWIRLGGKK